MSTSPLQISRRPAGTEMRYQPDMDAETIATLTEPSPCDACSNRALCATGRACRDFQVYVQTGLAPKRSRIPISARYRQMFEILSD